MEAMYALVYESCNCAVQVFGSLTEGIKPLFVHPCFQVTETGFCIASDLPFPHVLGKLKDLTLGYLYGCHVSPVKANVRFQFFQRPDRRSIQP